MKIKKIFKLFPDLVVKGPKEGVITSVTSNSKSAGPGSLFIAKKGLKSHGSDYVQEAVAAGASCLCLDAYDPLFPQITQLITSHPEKYESLLAAAFYSNPSQKLFTVGITGTSGKTTISYLLKHLLDKLSLPAGLLGSIEYDTGLCKHLASHTTPDSPRLQRYLYEMVESEKKSAVMEVTSHALAQGRVDSIHFDVAVFSGLSQDHLDYHKTMEAYALEKKKLFSSLEAFSFAKKEKWQKIAIVNADCPWGRQMVEDISFPVFFYGKKEGVNLQLKSYKSCAKGSFVCLSYLGLEKEIELPLIGEHNAYNALAAMGVCLSQGFRFEEVVKAFKGFTPVAGRLEKVDLGQPFSVYVDFAHKPDALRCVLQAVREKTAGKLYLVMGCGGDRDREKRPLMGAIAEMGADFTFLADDNPRTENAELILEEIAKGFKGFCYEKVGNRSLAIQKAIELARPADAVLIAGKGHETLQIFAHHSIDFDDRQEAKKAIENASFSTLERSL